MPHAALETLFMQQRIARWQAGELAAADDLFRAAAARLHHLARRMLSAFPGVRTQAETGDILQGASLRLLNALRVTRPADTRDFFRLAAVQIRRELLDLARRHAGQQTGASAVLAAAVDDQPAPAELELWCRFHQAVEALPAEEREAFSLVFYHDWTQPRVAALFGVSERTVRRWWQSACLRLNERLGGQMPPL